MRFCGGPRFAFVLKNGYNHEVAGRAVGSLVFAYGSGATTGNKMMGVSPIFFCRFSLWFGISGSTNVRQLGARPAGCLQVKPAGLPREHLRGHCATDGTD
jgi:hypothetical protein